jgi:hypothetical protein
VAEAFAVAADDDGFESGVGGKGSEEGGIAFANSEPGGESAIGGGGLDVAGEEGGGVVVDVVVEPGKQHAGFVGQGGERGGELRC